MMRCSRILAALSFARCGVFATPDPDKAHGTEDAFFASQKGLGVADGVGGWGEQGIHSGVFARATMHGAMNFLDAKMAKHSAGLQRHSGLEIMEAGHQFVLECAIPGSAPAVVCTIVEEEEDSHKSNKAARLSINNLGDCGILVLRGVDAGSGVSGVSVVYRSNEQQHYFNCPYQLASKDAGEDKTSMGEVGCVTIQDGDVVVMASDGLWDNVEDDEATKLIQACIGKEGERWSCAVAARDIGEFAVKESNRTTGLLPFGRRALEETGEKWEGGKIDDITVLVARICDDEHPFKLECPELMDVVFPLRPRKR